MRGLILMGIVLSVLLVTGCCTVSAPNKDTNSAQASENNLAVSPQPQRTCTSDNDCRDNERCKLPSSVCLAVDSTSTKEADNLRGYIFAIKHGKMQEREMLNPPGNESELETWFDLTSLDDYLVQINNSVSRLKAMGYDAQIEQCVYNMTKIRVDGLKTRQIAYSNWTSKSYDEMISSISRDKVGTLNVSESLNMLKFTQCRNYVYNVSRSYDLNFDEYVKYWDAQYDDINRVSGTRLMRKKSEDQLKETQKILAEQQVLLEKEAQVAAEKGNKASILFSNIDAGKCYGTLNWASIYNVFFKIENTGGYKIENPVIDINVYESGDIVDSETDHLYFTTIMPGETLDVKYNLMFSGKCNTNYKLKANLKSGDGSISYDTAEKDVIISGTVTTYSSTTSNPSTCSDGTEFAKCSVNKPKYCTGYPNLYLEDNSAYCGCPAGQYSTYSDGAWTCITTGSTTQPDEVTQALDDCYAATDACSWLIQSQFQYACSVAAEVRPSTAAVEKLHSITAQISTNKLCK